MIIIYNIKQIYQNHGEMMMNKYYSIVSQFVLMFFVWIGVQYVLFEPLHYWKTVIGSVVFSLIFVIGWHIMLTKIERKIKNEQNMNNDTE